MIVCLNTSSPICYLSLVEGEWRYDTNWQSGRSLAKGLLKFLDDELSFQGKTWQDVSGLVVYKGPGSFTGLRIGITVFNTLADLNTLPIVGETDEDWREKGIADLLKGVDHKLVLPEYGAEANITKPKK